MLDKGNKNNLQTFKDFLKKYGPNSVRMSSKIVFGGASATCSVFLMVEPCKIYTKTSDFGKTLIHTFGENNAWKLPFASSALDFAGMNFLFAPLAVQQFIDYISSIESTSVKIIKGTGIIILSGVANIQPLAVALSTGSTFNQILLSGIGLLPASVLSTLNLLTKELPALIRSFGSSGNDYKKFNADLREAWILHLKQRTKTVDKAQSLGERWAILLEDISQYKIDECFGSRFSREVVRGLGFLTAFPLTWANTWNLQEVMVNWIPYEIPARMLAAVVSVGFTYLFNKFISNLFVGIYDTFRNLYLGRPVDWLTLQLINRLSITVIMVGICAVGTTLSYPTALSLFMHAYHLIFKEELSYEVMGAIDGYHLVSLVECIGLSLKFFYEKFGSSEDQTLIFFHSAVEAAGKMDKFEISKQLKDHPDLYESYFLNRETKHSNIQDKTPMAPPQKHWFLSWCCFNTRGSTEEKQSLLQAKTDAVKTNDDTLENDWVVFGQSS